jgi:tetratricopeptide (TPR) repeat protein
VQHAHQKGIIHRDLKPSNVMVTLHDDKDVVKVIDFGIAKATGQQLTDKTVFTGFAQMIGTPLYMAPEQAALSNIDVDTRSDIYSLGVLLYELLTGTTPFDKERFKEVGYDEMRRIIREEEPPRPSTRLSTLGQAAITVSTQRKSDPKRLSQLVRGELDWIVMKCLDKDRNRRYETASGLAADVQHYLNDEPVLACPPSAWYRLRKFARRNRRGLAAAMAILLFIASLGLVVGWAVHDRDAREAALDDKVQRGLDEADARIEQGKWREALAAVERTEKFLAVAGRHNPVRLQDLQKDLDIVQRLEDIYAGPTGEPFFSALEQDDAYRKAFADCGIDVAALPVAEAAERIWARRIRQELVRGLDYWSVTRKSANNQASPDWKQLLEIAKAADQDAKRNRLREALKAEDRKALEALAASADVPRLPPQTLVLLGVTLKRLGSRERAEALLREAQRHYPADLWINDSLAVLCLSPPSPNYDDAVRFYAITVALRPNNPYLVRALGTALHTKGSLVDSVAMFSKAVELKPDYWQAWCDRGHAYLKAGQGDKGLADLSKAIELNPRNKIAWFKRGQAYAALHQYDKAILNYSKVIELDPKYRLAWISRGANYVKVAQYDKALADCREAMRLEVVRGGPFGSVYAANRWAWTLATDPKTKQRDGRHAVAFAQLAVNAAPTDRNYWHFWNTLGAAHYRAGDWQKAVTALGKSMELRKGGDSIDWFFLAMAHWRLGEKDKARQWFDRAVQWMDKNQRKGDELHRFRAEAEELLKREPAARNNQSDTKQKEP